MSTDQPSVPAQGTTNKLQLENQSLKRRLVQYAATLEKLTTHAKREIDQSTRARDEALSRAADASALRQKLSTMNASLTSAQSARDTANASLHRAEARVEQLQATLASLQRRLDDARYDDTHVASMREELHSLRKELPSLRRLREQDASRANTLTEQLEVEKQRSATYDSMVLRMQQLQTENSQLATDRDASEMALSNVRRSETSATRERDDLIVKLRESQDMSDMLRQQLDQLQDRVRLLEQRLKDAEATELRQEKDAADAKKQSDDAVSALREELDSALKDLGERNTMFAELKEKHDRSIDAESALAERDSMQSNIRQLQVELDQSTEMLTRAAIDALADKGKIRKLEDAISKLRGEVDGERKEKGVFETRIVNLTQQIAAVEGELDQVRTSKRELADECHKYQLQIHERDSVVASKNRALEELDTDRNDRAFRIDRLKLELSNSKNALAKKESDLVKITTEYEDMCSVLKSTNKDLDDKHGEVTRARREITAANDQMSKITQERDHLKVTVAELQVASRQVEELSALVNSKDEEIGSMKRWCTTLKAEAGESVREKKRLSDMLSDVSGDLKRANQELELLRNMRQEQEMLAQRISQIGETSSRELSDMRKSQSEQAEVLAKSTVEAYQGRIAEMQKSARHEIADTVSNQLRDDIMPHLMRAVDAKARNLVHALAKHVESFTVDDGMSYDFVKDSQAKPSTKVEVGAAASMERSTEYATSATASRSVSLSAPPSVPASGSRNAHRLSATESPPISSANASHGDYTGVETTAEPSAITSDRSVEAARDFAEPSSIPIPAGVRSETVEFQSESVDITDDIDPVAIHHRLTETYKQLLGGRTDLDLADFQTSTEVVEMNTTTRQVGSVSAEPVAPEESEKATAKASATEEVPVASREIPTVAMDKLEAPKPKDEEEELEIVESYVPKEGEVDESFEEGEEETEEEAPEEEGPEVAGEPADDVVEEFKDALADVVQTEPAIGTQTTEVAEEIVHEEDKDNEVVEPSTVEESQVLTRGFPVEQAEPEDKEIEAEALTQTETERELQQTSEVEAVSFESAPVPAVVSIPTDLSEAKEPAQTEVTALDTIVEEDVKDDAPEPVEPEVTVHDTIVEKDAKDDAPEPVEPEVTPQDTIVETDVKDDAPESVEPEVVPQESTVEKDVEDDAPEAVEPEVTPQEPTVEEDVEDDAPEPVEPAVIPQETAAEKDVEDDGPKPVEESQTVAPIVESGMGFQDESREPADSEEVGKDDGVETAKRDFQVTATKSLEPEMDDTVDAADGVQQVRKEVTGDDDLPVAVEDHEEVFQDASGEIDVALDDAQEEVKEAAEVEQEEDEPLGKAMPVGEEPVLKEVEEVPEAGKEEYEPLGEATPVAEEHGPEGFDREVEPAEETTEKDMLDEVHEEVKLVEEEELVTDKCVLDELHEDDQPLAEEMGKSEPEGIMKELDAPDHDGDGDEEHEEQEPEESVLESHEIPAPEAKATGVGEGDDSVGIMDATPEPTHETIPEQPAEDFVEEPLSGLPIEAEDRSAAEKVDDMAGDEQPRELDLSAPTEAVSEDIAVTVETGHPALIDETVEPSGAVESVTEGKVIEADVQAEAFDDSPLDSQLVNAGQESQQETGLDLSSGLEEAAHADDKIDSTITGEEAQEETIIPGQPHIPSQEDEDAALGDGRIEEGHEQEDAGDLGRIADEHGVNEIEVTTPVQETEGIVDFEESVPHEEDHEPNTGHGDVGEDAAVGLESGQGHEEDEGAEYVEEVDATKDDYGAEVDLETEPPVMAFATLNVVEEEDILEEDDILEDDDDDECDEDEEEQQGEHRADVQDRIEELDLTEGVPADLDDHSDLDDFEDAVQHDGVYGHAVVEELPDNMEEEEISAPVDQDDYAQGELMEQGVYDDAIGATERKEEEAYDVAAEEQQGASTTFRPLFEMAKEERTAYLTAKVEEVTREMGLEELTPVAATTGESGQEVVAGDEDKTKVDA